RKQNSGSSIASARVQSLKRASVMDSEQSHLDIFLRSAIERLLGVKRLVGIWVECSLYALSDTHPITEYNLSPQVNI
ncbi:hypothetical protein PN36_31360, partial [Candidatus Thiomargarita nelsonii]